MSRGYETVLNRIPDEIIRNLQGTVGSKNVLTDEVDLQLYSYDSALDRALPSAVVFPENTRQISSIVKICRQHKIPFVARGAGTNLCGGTIPLHDAMVIAPTRMNKIISIVPEKRTATVEPGVPNLFLKKVLEPYKLFYAPDPASQKACTIGGNIGTNAGGPHCLKYGVTSHHILGLEVVLPDGEIVKTDVNNPGYDLTGLFVGSEGTLGIVTRATLNLLPIPEQIETMLVSFPSLESATQTVTQIIAAGIIPATLEAMDKVTVHAVESFIHAGYPLDAEAVLLIEVDGSVEIKGQVNEIRKICEKNNCKEFRIAKNDREREKLWEGRRGSYPAMARLAPNVLVEDGAVPRNRLPEAVSKIRKIAEERNLKVSLIFHAGDGNLHPQILFDERDQEQSRKVKSAGYEMLKVCVSLGGTISGEHGIGIDKREAMRWLFTPQTLAQFRKLKNAFDPENLCNPDKLIPAAESDLLTKSNAKIDIYFDKHPNEPENEIIFCDTLRLLFSQKKEKIFIEGCKTHYSKDPGPYHFISTKSLNKILEHDVENFTVTVQAGMRVEDLQKELSLRNQKVLLLPHGSIGGMLASNPPQIPRIRDQVLGMKVAIAGGSLIEFGAKVMKNVAGYDAAKLFLGSWGTLGVIVSVILKTYPVNFPEASVPVEPLPSHPQTGKDLKRKIKTAFDPENIFPSPDELIAG